MIRGRFGNFVEIILGGTPKTDNPQYWGGDIPWVSVKDFPETKRIHKTEKTISELGLKNSNTKLLNTGDIILSARGTVGKVVVCAEKMAFNQSCYAIRSIDQGTLNQEYLYYLLISLVVELKQKAVGGVFDTIIKSTIEDLTISLPPLPTQKKIASILSAFDDLIENNLKRIKLLEEAAELLYKEWFVDFHFPGWQSTKFIDGLPEGWEMKPLSHFGEIVTGKTPSTKDKNNFGTNVPFVKTPDMHGSVFTIRTEQMLSELGASIQKKKMIPPGSVMVSCIGTAGVVGINATECQTNQQINTIIPKLHAYTNYLFLSARRLKEILDAIGSNGATMVNVNKSKFENISILSPTDKMIVLFDIRVKAIFKQILSLQKQVMELNSARDQVLPKLMSGEIKV